MEKLCNKNSPDLANISHRMYVPLDLCTERYIQVSVITM